MPNTLDSDDVLIRLARGLVVKEINLQDVLRHQSARTKAATQAVAQLDGFADCIVQVACFGRVVYG